MPAFRVNLGANELKCVDVPLNPTHSLSHSLVFINVQGSGWADGSYFCVTVTVNPWPTPLPDIYEFQYSTAKGKLTRCPVSTARTCKHADRFEIFVNSLQITCDRESSCVMNIAIGGKCWFFDVAVLRIPVLTKCIWCKCICRLISSTLSLVVNSSSQAWDLAYSQEAPLRT